MSKKHLSLKELISNCRILEMPPCPISAANTVVRAISHDSRQIEKDDLFIAISGFEADGHHYLRQAEKRGAVAAIVERVADDIPLPQFRVANSRIAQADLAAAFYDHPSRKMNLIGVTGSNGKTTTSLMIGSIFAAAGLPSGLVGTVEYRTGKSKIESKLTTPDSIDLQRYLAEMLESGIGHCVMEVSSIAQTQYRNRGCAFDVVCFINLGREHLDFHGSMEAYYDAKKQLMLDLPAEATAVLNTDDPWSIALDGALRAKIIRFGHENDADIRAENLDLSSGFAVFDLLVKEGLSSRMGAIPAARRRVSLQVPGYHSLMNALAAVAAGLAAGFSLDDCLRGVTGYQGVERRFQEIYKGEFRIFDDHFANAGNIELTLATLAKMDYKKLHMIYAIRGKRGVTVNRENIQAFARWADKLRLADFRASLSRDTAGHYDEVSPEEEAVFREEMERAAIAYRLFDKLEDCLNDGLADVDAGDLLLLAGCQGMDAGGRLALHLLAEREPERREEILAILKDRVCGW